jgi:hypothetical protein
MALRNTVNYSWARVILQNMLKALSAIPVAALFVTPKVRLFSGVTVPGQANAVADFTTAVYTGYADVALTLSAPVNQGLNSQAATGNVLFTSPGSGAFVADTATGYILFDGAVAYYGGERFASPVPFAAFGDYLDLEVILALVGITPIT